VPGPFPPRRRPTSKIQIPIPTTASAISSQAHHGTSPLLDASPVVAVGVGVAAVGVLVGGGAADAVWVGVGVGAAVFAGVAVFVGVATAVFCGSVAVGVTCAMMVFSGLATVAVAVAVVAASAVAVVLAALVAVARGVGLAVGVADRWAAAAEAAARACSPPLPDPQELIATARTSAAIRLLIGAEATPRVTRPGSLPSLRRL
jgi:hypothetical protein